MKLGRFEVACFTILGIVLFRGVLALLRDVIIPAPTITAAVPEEREAALPRESAPYMPDVEMDDWIQNNGMPTRGGWTPTSPTHEEM